MSTQVYQLTPGRCSGVSSLQMKTTPLAILNFLIASVIGAAGLLIEQAFYGRTISPANVAGMGLLAGGMYFMGRTS
jgi:hypothetical protein